MLRLHRSALLATCLTLSGCGVTYVSPEVSKEGSSYEVSVIAMTPTAVSKANSSKYRSKSLPAEFSQTATVGNSSKGPQFLANSRSNANAQIDFRRPPELEHPTYQIGIGDVISLTSRSAGLTPEQLRGLLNTQNHTVRDDGAIAIPAVGTVVVEGLTIEEAEERVFQRFVQNQLDPELSLEIAEFNSKRVSIGGSVKLSQLVPITLNPLYLDEAITAAGGISLPIDESGSIRLYRQGKQYQIPLEVFFKDISARRILLADGDAVYVKSEVEGRRIELQERRENFLAKLELGAIDQDHVYLTGETKEQSRAALPFEIKASLADILYENGGFPTSTGNPSHIYVLRTYNAEKLTAFHLDAKNVVNLAMATKFEMRPDDIIFIQEQPITVWGRALQQAFPALISAGASSLN